MFLSLKEKVLKLNNNWKFENIIALIFVLFGILGWQFSYIIGAIPTILFSVILMILTNKFKYTIPAILVLLFSYNKGFEVGDFPFDIVIPVAIYVIFIVIFSILKFKLKKLKNIKYIIGMSILSITFIIPIFWSSIITEEYNIFYIMYFSWLLYTLLYVILCIVIENDSFKITVFSFSYLSLLITYELGVTLLKWHYNNPDQSIFEFWSYIGWGLCNEAGIVLCFILPFIFYELFNAKNKIISIISILKYLIAIGGILISMARGSYICGTLISFSFLLFLIFKKNKLRLFKISIIFSIVILALIILFVKFDFIDLFKNTVLKIFEKGFDGNGRNEIWECGVEAWSEANYKMVFGSGIVSEIKKLDIFHGIQYSFAVYHSTTLEVLISAGILGLVGLGIHIAEKYMMLFKNKNKTFIFIFFIGYLFVDLYGLIDNTYGMYYYMVPLFIMMATINNCDNFELFE